ncbi:MAG: metallophosphoesterase family protein [Bacteroidetes bacterium]|nr:metallophosphoesterase family protein [Bacteroidota bacterium]
MRIGLLSDTHGFLDDKIFNHFQDCDEIWHAGDFGNIEISEKLSAFKSLKGVYGNIDGMEIRSLHPKDNKFVCEDMQVWMTHIGGYPGKYSPEVRKEIYENPPDIFICGHSHILRVITDKKLVPTLYINPGAAGKQGLHMIRTIIKFDIIKKKVVDMKVVELGKR